MKNRKWILLLLIVAVAALLTVKQSLNNRAAGPARAPGEADENLVLTGASLAGSLKSGRPTLAEFGKGTCKVCQQMEPVLQEAARDYAHQANVVSVDLDDFATLGHSYKIATMPTQIFFDAEGEEVSRHMGFMPLEDIAAQLDALGAKR